MCLASLVDNAIVDCSIDLQLTDKCKQVASSGKTLNEITDIVSIF